MCFVSKRCIKMMCRNDVSKFGVKIRCRETTYRNDVLHVVSNDVLDDVLKDMLNGASNATAGCRSTVFSNDVPELRSREFGQSAVNFRAGGGMASKLSRQQSRRCFTPPPLPPPPASGTPVLWCFFFRLLPSSLTPAYLRVGCWRASIPARELP